jgi:hypothetical protein
LKCFPHRAVILLGIVYATILSCVENSSHLTKWTYLNKPFETVMVMHEFEVAKSRLINHNLLKQFGENNLTDGFKSTLDILNNISLEGEALLAISSEKDFQYLFIADTLDLKHNFELSDDFIKDTLITYKTFNIKHTQLQNNEIYSVQNEAFYLQTNHLERLKSVLEIDEPSLHFSELQQLTDINKTISIVCKNDNLLRSFFRDDSATNLADYYVLDVSLEETKTALSGVTQSTDSTSTLNSLKNAKPCNMAFESILPDNVSNGISLCLSDISDFTSKLQPSVRDSLPGFLNLAVEASVFTLNNQEVMALRFPDKTIVAGEILSETIQETNRDINIYNFSKPAIFEDIFKPFLSFSKANFVFEINNFYVFTEQTDLARDIINYYTSGKTIDQTNAYKEIEPNLSNQSSITVFQNQSTLQQTFAEVFKLEKQPKLSYYELSAFQLIYEDNFAHINGIISQRSSRSESDGLKELFSISLENNIVGNPQFFTNHLNNTKDVLVQDTGNTLYLISKDGKIFWKKRLDGPIRVSISEMDIYRNGRIQMAFVTDKTLYVLDRNGNDVSGFPKKFDDNITQPLSVFDYDNNNNYRLVVTQKSDLLMFDKTGKTVTGFKPDLPDKTVSTSPKHFRIGNKDYIVFAQENQLQILDRVGKTRIKVDNEINFSENDIYVNQNSFVTVTSNSKLFKVNTKGISSFSDLKTLENTQITANPSALVIFSENKLQINSVEKELDFGNYTAPQLFQFNNKLYISITDLQSKKGFVMDAKGKILDNFPIYASGAIQISNGTGKRLYVLTTTDNNSLILYEL